MYVLERTISRVYEILVNSKNNVVEDIRNVFEIVNEDFITFTFVLNLKKCIDENLNELKCCVLNDIIYNIYSSTGYTVENSRVEDYVGKALIVDAKMHSRSFESSTSGSDFGLLFQIPILDIYSSGVNVVSTYNGILVQAKRNAQKGRPPEQFRKLSKSYSNFSVIRDFFSLAFYKFGNHDGQFKLSDILFLPLNNIKGDNKEFIGKVNNILIGKENPKLQDAKEFFLSFLICDLGTTDNSKIEKYILGSKLPIIEIKIEFRDSGRAIDKIVREKNRLKQIINEEEKVKEYVYTS